MNTRVNAFTLIEMVLAMMLAAIVIGMVYSAFSLFSRLYGGYRTKNMAHAEVRILKQVLEHDLEQASVIERDGVRVYVKSSTGLEDLIYEPGENLLIRTRPNMVPDTFRLKGLVLQTLFEGVQVGQGVTDRVILRFEYEQELMLISAAKAYTSTDLFTYQNARWKQ